MATRKKAGTKTIRTTEILEPERDELDEPDPFEIALEEFGDESDIGLTIHRYDDEGQRAYLRKVIFNSEIHTLDWIRKLWGPGRFLLRFNLSGDRSKTRNKVVNIAPDGQPANAQQQPGGGFSDPYLRMYLDSMQKQNEILLQAVANRTGGGGGGGGEAMYKVLDTALAAALNRPQVGDTLMNAFTKGIEVMGNLKSDHEGDWTTQLGKIARDVLPALAEAAKHRAAAAPVNVTPPGAPPPAGAVPGAMPALVAGVPLSSPAGAPPPGGPPPPAGPPPPEPTPAQRDDVLEQLIQQYAPQLQQFAEQGAPPNQVAESILRMVPMFHWPMFDSLTADRILGANPELAPKRDWVETLVREIKENNQIEEGQEEPEGAA